VNGNRIYGFQDIALEVALGDPRHSEVSLRRDGRELAVPVQPSRNVSEGRWELGIGPAGDVHALVTDGSPAARAGLLAGDRVLEINGTELTAASAGVYQPALGKPVTIAWEHDGQRHEATIEPAILSDAEHARLGVMALGTRVAGLRGAALSPRFAWRPDDVVRSIAGTPVFQAEDLLAAVAAAPAGDVPTVVRRDRQSLEVTLAAGDRQPLAAGDVAFEPDTDSSVVQIAPGGALAAAGLRDGDQIVSIDDEPIEDYADLQREVRGPPRTCRVRYRGQVDGAVHSVTVDTLPAEIPDYGFNLPVLETMHEEALPGALRAGFDTSLNIVRTTWLTLTKLFTGDVATKNLGGIVSISVITYHFAEWGLPKLLFFLGLLSINLGFINVLPIPVLDGGQVMFLVLEKIKGGRLSDRVMNGMQLAGLGAIVLLVLYVTYNDIARLVR
ncbi:MAG TPA: RIP metalloprotease RseP, partial [Planctomycetota bacterium]|nr:RIP metalloprotease RseP [Planctomycetota bacterium]